MARPDASAGEEERLHEEIRRLAAYVASIVPGPAFQRGEYDPPTSARDIARGGSCSGPTLGLHTSKERRGPAGGQIRAVTEGRRNKTLSSNADWSAQMPVFSDEVIRPEDKRAIIVT